MSNIVVFSYFRKRLKTSFQNPLYIGNQNPIICHGNLLIPGTGHAVLHFSFIQHASSAVDNQSVLSQFLRKLCPRRKLKFQTLSRILPDPARDLNSADIIALPVVGAPLTDQYLIPVPQGLQAFCPLHIVLKAALIPGKQDGE